MTPRRSPVLAAALVAGAAHAAAPPGAASSDQIAPAKLVGSPYSVNDYPQAAMRLAESGYARIAVTVSPDGKPVTCEVIGSSGFRDLDERSCSVMMKRGRFTPAVDTKGQRAYGVYRQLVPWFVADTQEQMRVLVTQYEKPSEMDVEVTVSSLPKGLPSPLAVVTTVVVLADGGIGPCSAADGGAVPAALAKVACEQTAAVVRFKPARDTGGTPVASVQQAKVAFLIEPGAASK